MKISLITLGCKVNQYESLSLMRELGARGHDVVFGLEEADVYVVNTCAITAEGERKSRQVLSKIKALGGSRVIVCGCASQKSPQSFVKKAKDEGLDALVCGTFGKAEIALLPDVSGVKLAPMPTAYEDDLSPYPLREREYVKVQDGCDNFCSYCIVPYLRGRSRSRSVESVIAEIKAHEAFCPEFVITGINLSDYGKGIEGYTGGFKGLIDAMADAEIKSRIRLGSLEARVIDREFLLSLSRLGSFCPSFHLSLQSGSDAVLKSMNRKYGAEEYYNACALIREIFPSASVTTDVICGFPTETEENFDETLSFVKKCGFSRIHIFPYSRREGTVAAKMQDLPREVKTDRTRRLKRVADEVADAFIAQNIGKRREVLIEEVNSGTSEGYTENYIRCFIDGEYKVGDVVCVKPCKKYRDGVFAVEIKN